MLTDIPTLWKAAHDELAIGKGGDGGKASEMSIGVNVSALSFINGSDILNLLHSWESLIRQDRRLTPPALIAKPASIEIEINDAIKFALINLEWSARQYWIGDFANELDSLHQLAKTAAKDFTVKEQTIACPSTTSDGLPCGARLKTRDDQLEEFECPRCHSSWSVLRLMAVALSNPAKQVWLDAEAIGHSLGISPASVPTLAKRHGVLRRNGQYNFKQFLATRPNAS